MKTFKCCHAREDSWESLGLQGDQISQSQRKSALNIHWEDWCWSFNILATWCEKLTHWKGSWCWERLKAKREGDDRGWGSWMASPIQCTWIWAKSGRWWRTGECAVLQSMELQRVGHNWATNQKQTYLTVRTSEIPFLSPGDITNGQGPATSWYSDTFPSSRPTAIACLFISIPNSCGQRPRFNSSRYP